MGSTLTVRTTKELRQALEERARDRGQSVSDLVREILEEALAERPLAERPLAERTAHLKGCLNLPEPAEGWRRQIRERNWRP